MSKDKIRESLCAEVARLLRVERERRELSLNCLATHAGLSRQMISYVEQNKRNPSLETLLRITDALGIELEEVIKRARQTASAR